MVEVDFHKAARNWVFRLGRVHKFGQSHDDVCARCIDRIGRVRGVLYLNEVESLIGRYEAKWYDSCVAWRAEDECTGVNARAVVSRLRERTAYIPEIRALSWVHVPNGRLLREHRFSVWGPWCELDGHTPACPFCGGPTPMHQTDPAKMVLTRDFGGDNFESHCGNPPCRKLYAVYTDHELCRLNIPEKAWLLEGDTRRQYLLLHALRFSADRRTRRVKTRRS